MRALMRNRGRITLIEMMIVIVMVSFLAMIAVAPTAQAAEYWKEKFTRFSATAGETLATGDVVCLQSIDSRAYKADADVTQLRVAVGVIGKGGTAGQTVEVVVSGILAGQTAASVGSRLYLDTTAGVITTTLTSNTWAQVIGFVMQSDLSASVAQSSSAIYFINIQPGIASGSQFY